MNGAWWDYGLRIGFGKASSCEDASENLTKDLGHALTLKDQLIDKKHIIAIGTMHAFT